MRREGIVESISYSLINGLELSMKGYPDLYRVRVDDIKFGGKNCEISRLVVGGKISFDIEAMHIMKNVIILSDGIREVDEEGNLIKW